MLKVSEICSEVSQLPPQERAEIAAYILEGLSDAPYTVSDDEVHRRSAELNSGEVKAISHEEFLKACGR
ncbi:MAG: addiction module protein [Akkermansiaceae bacterium]